VEKRYTRTQGRESSVRRCSVYRMFMEMYEIGSVLKACMSGAVGLVVRDCSSLAGYLRLVCNILWAVVKCRTSERLGNIPVSLRPDYRTHSHTTIQYSAVTCTATSCHSIHTLINQIIAYLSEAQQAINCNIGQFFLTSLWSKELPQNYTTLTVLTIVQITQLKSAASPATVR
jgi:hypothetical protein